MSLYHSPNTVTRGLVLYLDAANPRSYPGSGTTWSDLSGNQKNFTLYNSSYYTYSQNNSGYIDFNRTMPPTAETGGYASLVGSGELSVSTYLYNDHTTEIWANIDDIDATLYNSTESNSALFVYKGYHSMFRYNSSGIRYTIWNGTTNEESDSGLSFTTDLSEGEWFNYTVTRQGNNLNTYLNGVLKATKSINTSSGSGGVSNTISIGMANPSNSNYSWHANVKVSSAKMYNRALSESEISQNFNATRGRYGI